MLELLQVRLLCEGRDQRLRSRCHLRGRLEVLSIGTDFVERTDGAIHSLFVLLIILFAGAAAAALILITSRATEVVFNRSSSTAAFVSQSAGGATEVIFNRGSTTLVDLGAGRAAEPRSRHRCTKELGDSAFKGLITLLASTSSRKRISFSFLCVLRALLFRDVLLVLRNVVLMLRVILIFEFLVHFLDLGGLLLDLVHRHFQVLRLLVGNSDMFLSVGLLRGLLLRLDLLISLFGDLLQGYLLLFNFLLSLGLLGSLGLDRLGFSHLLVPLGLLDLVLDILDLILLFDLFG